MSTSESGSDLGARAQALIEVLGSRYHFVSMLGSGAFGEVYCVHDTMLEREVAVKRVRLDAFADDAQRKELRERTIREARVAAKLKHPHIVTIHDVVDRPDMSFIVMELIEGRTLASLLKERGRLSLDETVRILSQAASALDFAHMKGVVHRDIKPANIMIETAGGGVKVTDFGIAKSDKFTEITAAGSVLGTPNYMSPEQARGEASIRSSADLFSLGCVAYECLIGQKAFSGPTVMATLLTIMNEPPREFDSEALGLDRSIHAILNRALAKHPSDRYSTGGELIDALSLLPSTASPAGESTLVIESPLSRPPAAPLIVTPRPPLVVTRRVDGQHSSFDSHLHGTLAETAVAGLIREIYAARGTGILHFEREGASKRIYFKTGSVVFANSDVNEDRLGEFLIRQGEIDRALFDRVSEAMRRTGQRMGKTLTDLGLFSNEQVKEFVRRQVQGIIYSVFDWKTGTYGFEILDRPVEEDIIVELSTAELILTGVRTMHSIDQVQISLGSLDRVLRHTENPLLLYQKMTLTPSEGYVLSRVDGSTSIAEIAAISPLGGDETLRCVYALVSAGVVELAAKSQPVTSRIQAPGTRPESGSAEAVRKAPSEPEEPPAHNEHAELIAAITAKQASLAGADYYGLLEVSPGASDEEIKRGYYAMAKKYHPDRHHLPELREMQSVLEEIFARVTDAYQQLSDPASRRRYDGARFQKAREAAPSPAASDSGIKKGATPPVSYVPPPEVVAERHFQQGYGHFERGEFFDAIQCLRECVRIVPGETRYHKLLAKALSKNPNWRKEAETHFQTALKGNEFDLECLFGLGEIYEAAGLAIRAKVLYERILAYDPDYAPALEKLSARGKRKK
jgi:serine/threonine protein kinase/curved DNA-binding protein CbpA